MIAAFHACKNSQTKRATDCIGPFESQRRASAPVPESYYRSQGEGSTPPVIQRVQNFGRLISQQGADPKEYLSLTTHSRQRVARGVVCGRVIELADFQGSVAVCLVVVGHVYPRCSRKKRTGEIREENADASVVPEQRSRQQRRPSVHAVKHRSTSCTNTDVSVRSAEKEH